MSQKCHAQRLCWEAQCNIPLISEEESVSNSCTIPETKSLHLRRHLVFGKDCVLTINFLD